MYIDIASGSSGGVLGLKDAAPFMTMNCLSFVKAILSILDKK